MILITPDIFSRFNNLKAFMSTKVGGVNTPPYFMNTSFNVNDTRDNVELNRKYLFNSINIEHEYLVLPEQTHSDNVCITDKPGRIAETDALITNLPNLFLTITVADCVPVYLYDDHKKIVALVHSGWQGTVKKILSRTLDIMIEKMGSEPKNIYSFIGPSASQCCYEVSNEVADKFPKETIQFKEGKPFPDLKLANLLQLSSAGVPESNIEVSEFCTICNPDMFHSYRRDGNQSGRMLNIFGMV